MKHLPDSLPYRAEVVPIDPGQLKQEADDTLRVAMKSVERARCTP